MVRRAVVSRQYVCVCACASHGAWCTLCMQRGSKVTHGTHCACRMLHEHVACCTLHGPMVSWSHGRVVAWSQEIRRRDYDEGRELRQLIEARMLAAEESKRQAYHILHEVCIRTYVCVCVCAVSVWLSTSVRIGR